MSEQPDPAGNGNGARSFYDAPRASDEVYEGFNENKPIRYARLPEDGLPMPLLDDTDVKRAERLPLHESTLVCMADTRAFVLRQVTWGAEVARFAPSEVRRMPNGCYVVPTRLAAERVPEVYRNCAALNALAAKEDQDVDDLNVWAAEEMELPVMMDGAMATTGVQPWAIVVLALRDVQEPRQQRRPRRRFKRRGGSLTTAVITEDDRHLLLDEQWCEVEPIRPQCQYYARQRIDHPADPEDHRQIVRLCTARRDADGVFLSLTDDRMHGCELRSPPHQQSVDAIEQFDAGKIVEGERAQQEEEVWDVEKALADEARDAD